MNEDVMTDGDVYTLIGHAEVMRMDGKKDMPAYFFELDRKISVHTGMRNLQNGVSSWRTGHHPLTDESSNNRPAQSA